ncbi:MAG: shikimate kinase [Bacteroidales bacterium]|nr:shikimate kinase [Bacteroidales bacterium]
MRFFIIGYKNCGKTTIGRQLATRLSMEFIDLDEVIEVHEGKSIPELYSDIGDQEFRIREWKALKKVVLKDNIVVSTGGGAPCHCENMDLMEKHGEVLYIKLDTNILVDRLKKVTNDRPIVLNKTDSELQHYITDLRDRCEHHYLRAKYIVDGIDLTVEKVLNILGLTD